jgi:transcriptional regulator with XRE-family HTH domain
MSGRPQPPSSAAPAASSFTARDLRLLRRAREISLSQAAQLVGVDASYLSLIERERRPCPPELGLKLLRLLWEQPQ